MTATERSRWIALYVLCTGMLMIVLDVTVVNVALPYIQNDLKFSPADLAWVVNAYLIAFGGLLLLAGRLGDLVGRRRLFLAGLAVFTVASMVCGLATNQLMLVLARFVQGAGGALTSAVILGMIVTMFPEPREQAKAIGVFAFVASAGGAVGLLAGGALTQSINWHWIFFINVPIGLATAMLARRYVGADGSTGLASGMDVGGAVLVTAALMLGVYTIVKPAAELGWGSTSTLGFAALSAILLAAFFIREATAANPLMPLRIFRSRNVCGANLIQILGAAGMFGTFFLGALYVQKVLRYDPLEIGVAFLPVSVFMGTISVRYSERLIGRFGARALCAGGMGMIAIALMLLAMSPTHGGYWLTPVPRPDHHRNRRRYLLPAADGTSDVRRDAGRCRARLGRDQHDRPGRRGARPGGAGHRDLGPDRPLAGERARLRCSPDRRVPPRVLDLGRPGAGRRAGRADRAAGAGLGGSDGSAASHRARPGARRHR